MHILQLQCTRTHVKKNQECNKTNNNDKKQKQTNKTNTLQEWSSARESTTNFECRGGGCGGGDGQFVDWVGVYMLINTNIPKGTKCRENIELGAT